MVQAMIDISEDANQILNIVKAKENLKDKSQAIEKVVLEYGADDIIDDNGVFEIVTAPEEFENIKEALSSSLF